MQFDKGYIAPYFVTDAEAGEAVLEDAYILVTTQKISAIEDLLPLLEKVLKAGKPLLIIAEDVDGQALSTLVVNSIRKTIKVCAVKAPGFGDRRKAMLQDIAVLTGGEVVASELGYKLDSVGLEVLGSARRVVVTKETTTIVDGGGKDKRGQGPGRPDPQGDRGLGLRLGQGEAERAPRQALRRHRRHQGRRRDRGRDEGAQAPHRGRDLGHQGGGRGGRHPRRWRHPHPDRGHPRRRARPQGRRGHRGGDRAQGAGRAAALDRPERRPRRLRRGGEGPRVQVRQRPQRGHRRSTSTWPRPASSTRSR